MYAYEILVLLGRTPRKLVVTDVSGRPTGPIFKTMKTGPIGCLGTNYPHKPRNIPEERKSHLQSIGSLNHILKRILHISVILSETERFVVTILYKVRRQSCVQFLLV